MTGFSKPGKDKERARLLNINLDYMPRFANAIFLKFTSGKAPRDKSKDSAKQEKSSSYLKFGGIQLKFG